MSIPVESSLPATPVIVDASATASSAGTADAAAATPEVIPEQRTFRQVIVGLIRFPGKRRTWVLLRATDHVRLRLACQLSAQQTLRLDGRESDDAQWGPPVVTEWEGVLGQDLSGELTLSPGSAGSTACGDQPARLELQCHDDRVDVHAAGAILVAPRRGGGDSGRTPWKPASHEREEGFVCSVSWQEREMRFIHDTLGDGKLVFVPPSRRGPGVEWAEENSDVVVQMGGYRWMPAPR